MHGINELEQQRHTKGCRRATQRLAHIFSFLWTLYSFRLQLGFLEFEKSVQNCVKILQLTWCLRKQHVVDAM